jgi:hypothetical protein
VHAFVLAWHPPTFGEDDYSYSPTSLATPMSLPIRATYDAYGAVDNVVEGSLERRLFSHLRRLYEHGELRLSGDLVADRLEPLLKCIADGRATARVLPPPDAPPPQEPRELILSLMFVDSRVYEAVVALVRESKDWEAEWRVGGPRGPKDARAAMDAKCEWNRNLAFYRLGSKVTADLLERMAELYDFELALQLLRRCYAPPTGAGSQSTAYLLHADTASAVQRIAREDAAREE